MARKESDYDAHTAWAASTQTQRDYITSRPKFGIGKFLCVAVVILTAVMCAPYVWPVVSGWLS